MNITIRRKRKISRIRRLLHLHIICQYNYKSNYKVPIYKHEAINIQLDGIYKDGVCIGNTMLKNKDNNNDRIKVTLEEFFNSMNKSYQIFK